jgi:hypothetical protein
MATSRVERLYWWNIEISARSMGRCTAWRLRCAMHFMPPLAVQDAIGEVLVALDEKVDIHERISQSAARLRDTLAQLLITGAIGT